MSVSDGKRLKDLEAENARFKKPLAAKMFENDVIKYVPRKNALAAPVRRALVREIIYRGLSERRELAVARTSASAFRYEPRPDRNVDLRE